MILLYHAKVLKYTLAWTFSVILRIWHHPDRPSSDFEYSFHAQRVPVGWLAMQGIEEMVTQD
jgi:hypothetical protein